MEKIYNKLVRDRIPSILEGLGEHPTYKELDQASFKREVLKALIEASNGVIAAKGKSQKQEALVDLYEIVKTIGEIEGISMVELKALAEEKCYIKGGFRHHVYLVKTGIREDE